MPANERDDQALQLAQLRADVRHIQADTTEIKADLRMTNQRIDSLALRTDERIEHLRCWAEDRFDKVDKRFEGLEKKFDDLKDSLTSAKVWALGLYIALAGSMFYVLARGFKWLWPMKRPVMSTQ